MARGNELSDGYTKILTCLKGQRLNIAETRAVSTDVGVVFENIFDIATVEFDDLGR